MAHKKSQWFLALLDAEQHVYEGYSIHTLKHKLLIESLKLNSIMKEKNHESRI